MTRKRNLFEILKSILCYAFICIVLRIAYDLTVSIKIDFVFHRKSYYRQYSNHSVENDLFEIIRIINFD